MNTATSNYQETSAFIHQRYEDTAFIIFQQQQKIRQDEKRRQQQQNSAFNRPFFPAAATNQTSEFNRYGNRGVITKEAQPSPTKTLSPVNPPKSPSVPPTKPISSSGNQPTVNSSTDNPDQVVRRRRRRRKKIVVSIESSV